MQKSFPSASGGFALLVPSDRIEICSANLLRSYLIAGFIERYITNNIFFCFVFVKPFLIVGDFDAASQENHFYRCLRVLRLAMVCTTIRGDA